MANADKCICCGEIIPEGMLACPNCLVVSKKVKRLISVGDVVYIIGKYSFSRDENPQVVEVQVAYTFRKKLYAYPTKGHGTFCLVNSDLGKTVFWNRDDAERVLRRYLDVSD